MTPEEIRAVELRGYGDTVCAEWLREIAAQLATLNESLTAMQIRIQPKMGHEPVLVGLRVGTHQMVKP